LLPLAALLECGLSCDRPFNEIGYDARTHRACDKERDYPLDIRLLVEERIKNQGLLRILVKQVLYEHWNA
jgi:hypothetical protein